jgi:hypothetical protein
MRVGMRKYIQSSGLIEKRKQKKNNTTTAMEKILLNGNMCGCGRFNLQNRRKKINKHKKKKLKSRQACMLYAVL